MLTALYVTIATSEFPRARRAPSHLIRMRRAYVHAVSLSLHTGFISFPTHPLPNDGSRDEQRGVHSTWQMNMIVLVIPGENIVRP